MSPRLTFSLAHRDDRADYKASLSETSCFEAKEEYCKRNGVMAPERTLLNAASRGSWVQMSALP